MKKEENTASRALSRKKNVPATHNLYFFFLSLLVLSIHVSTDTYSNTAFSFSLYCKPFRQYILLLTVNSRQVPSHELRLPKKIQYPWQDYAYICVYNCVRLLKEQNRQKAFLPWEQSLHTGTSFF
jgi:hypothetical protein